NHSLVAAAAASESGQAGAPEHLFVARLGPRSHLHLALAPQRGNAHRGAEHRLGCRYRDHADEVGALAAEALVLGDPHLDVEVAGRGAEVAGVAGAAHPQLLAVLDPSGDLDLGGAPPTAATAAATDLAGRLRDFAGAATDVADG